MRKPGYPGHFWPSPLQEQVLRAALLPGEAGAAAWARLRPDLDVDDLRDFEIYRLLPLVQRNLEGLGVDDRDLPRMRGLARRTWYENQMRLQELLPDLERLRSAGIDVMVLKGVPLGLQYYRDLSLRPMADVDVLVPTGAAEEAMAVLEADGWPVSRRKLRDWHGTGLVHPDGRTLDLHWHVSIWLLLADEPRTDDDFWSASVPIEVSGLPLRALCPADQLLHVCIHGAWSVSYAQVRWIADAATVVRAAGDNLDWDRLTAQVSRRRVMLPVGTALRYLAEEFDVPVPARVLATLGGLRPTRRERRAFQANSRRIIGRRLVGHPLAMWAYWSQRSAKWSRGRAFAGFLGFVKEIWGIDNTWELPAVAASKAVGKLLPARLATRSRDRSSAVNRSR
jgi:hypothetical protein